MYGALGNVKLHSAFNYKPRSKVGSTRDSVVSLGSRKSFLTAQSKVNLKEKR